MSDKITTHWAETAVRYRAYAMLRQCWKPILLAMLIVTLLDFVSLGVYWAGLAAAERALADMPLATEPATVEEMLDYYSSRNAATAAAQNAYRPYGTARTILKLINRLVVSPIVLVGLYSSLLAAQRSGECTLRNLLQARPYWGRAMLLSLMTTLITGAVRFSGNAVTTALGDTMYIFGIILGMIVWLAAQVFVDLRLCLAHVALADGVDDPAAATTPVQAISASWQNVREYTVFGMLCTLWPVLLLKEIMPFVYDKLPSSMLTDVGCILVQTATMAVYWCCLVCIYDDIHREPEPDPDDEGLARARALAAGAPTDLSGGTHHV